MISPALEGLRQRFIARCQIDLEAVRKLAIDPSQGSEPEVRSVIHRISGIAGSLGYPELSNLAKCVDDGFVDGALPRKESICQLEAELARVSGDS